MTRLAFRNLFQSKARLLISVGGVALALLLILSLDAVFTGMERRVTAYIDQSGADIFVSQAGVRNMHMAASWLPAAVQAQVEAVPGVASATPILYLANVVIAGGEQNFAYVIGLPAGAEAGGAWQISQGRGQPGPGETVIDRGVADKAGLTLGDEVEILGRRFAVVGLSEGTASLVNSVAFIAAEDFTTLRGQDGVISFLLVKVEASQDAPTVAARIESDVEEVTALPRSEFARQERQVIKDMSTEVLAIMNLTGFLVGLAVMALTVYTATLSRRAEYGVLKALGARNSHLYRAVLTQAFLSVGLGFSLGLGFALLLAVVAPYLSSTLTLAISGSSLFKVGTLSLVIAGLSALLPIRQIAGLDPAMVFRGQ
ncbi:MAG: ABC transporter permease [Chloroflexota bacterium]